MVTAGLCNIKVQRRDRYAVEELNGSKAFHFGESVNFELLDIRSHDRWGSHLCRRSLPCTLLP